MSLLGDRRLLVVTGKGGVGKSTVAAALALSLSRGGKRTLVCEVHAKERVTGFLERPAAGPSVTQVDPNLWAVDIQPEEALHEYALMRLRFESVYKAVFENRVTRYFLRFIPSVQEIVMLGKVLYHLNEKREDGSLRFERVVMDAPATGHAISFLSVPQVLLDTVPPGPLHTDAKLMRDLLFDPAMTAAVLVSLPDEMAVNETIELGRALKDKVRVQPRAVALNFFVGERFGLEDLETLRAKAPSLYDKARVHTLRARLCVDAEDKLRDELGLPILRIPRLFAGRFGRAAIEEVARSLLPLVSAA